MRLKNVDLLLAMVTVAMNMLWVLVPSRTPVIGTMLALPLVFVLPGYGLTEVMFHKRPLDVAHRLTSSLALSLAIVILSGFILNILPVGLHAISWAMFLGVLTMIFSLWVALLRRRTQVSEMRLPRLHLALHEYILFGLAVLVAVLSVQYSAVSVEQQPHPGFTQLWMLPSKQANNSCAVSVGVQSFETTSVTYRIVMMVDGNQVNTWSSIVLSPQQAWKQSIAIKPDAVQNTYIEAWLYRTDKPSIVYRNVHLTFRSLTGSNVERMQQCSL